MQGIGSSNDLLGNDKVTSPSQQRATQAEFSEWCIQQKLEPSDRYAERTVVSIKKQLAMLQAKIPRRQLEMEREIRAPGNHENILRPRQEEADDRHQWNLWILQQDAQDKIS